MAPFAINVSFFYHVGFFTYLLHIFTVLNEDKDEELSFVHMKNASFVSFYDVECGNLRDSTTMIRTLINDANKF